MVKISFDAQKCTGCRACEGACKQEHDLPWGVRWRVVTYKQEWEHPNLRRVYKSNACGHCGKPMCLAACQVKAIYKDEITGIVDIIRELCTGCQDCVSACPFQAMSFEPEAKICSKCNYCKDRIVKGLEPACVSVCMALALRWER